MTELAKRVVIRRTGDEYEFSIDGQPFPWHIDSRGLTTVIDSGSIPSVTFTLLAERVDVVHDLAKAKTEDPAEQIRAGRDYIKRRYGDAETEETH